MQPYVAELSLVHGRLGAGQMAGLHIHPVVNRPFLLVLLEDLSLSANSIHSRWIMYCARLIAGSEVITAH